LRHCRSGAAAQAVPPANPVNGVGNGTPRRRLPPGRERPGDDRCTALIATSRHTRTKSDPRSAAYGPGSRSELGLGVRRSSLPRSCPARVDSPVLSLHDDRRPFGARAMKALPCSGRDCGDGETAASAAGPGSSLGRCAVKNTRAKRKRVNGLATIQSLALPACMGETMIEARPDQEQQP
jgi:hypothetical protein